MVNLAKGLIALGTPPVTAMEYGRSSGAQETTKPAVWAYSHEATAKEARCAM